jgi:hypothetical protein
MTDDEGEEHKKGIEAEIARLHAQVAELRKGQKLTAESVCCLFSWMLYNERKWYVVGLLEDKQYLLDNFVTKTEIESLVTKTEVSNAMDERFRHLNALVARFESIAAKLEGRS